MIKFLVRQKILFGRGYSHIGALGIGYLVASKLQEQIYHYWELGVPLTVLFPLGVLGVWFVGWCDCHFGMWEAEARMCWEANPDQARLTKGNL